MSSSVVVDSSVWIDFFNKKSSSQIEIIKSQLLSYSNFSPFIILPIILQEILQGIEDENQYKTVLDVLSGLEKLEINQFICAEKASELYRFLRKKGVTIRKANDCLIAAVCIENKFSLLHNDKDFNNIAKFTSLKIYK